MGSVPETRPSCTCSDVIGEGRLLNGKMLELIASDFRAAGKSLAAEFANGIAL